MALAFPAVTLGGPLLFGLAGLLLARRRTAATAPPRWDWRISVQSSLLYVIAFNVTFFIQELFLVLPKAFTPGLRPTLYHNNHRWEGDHALAALFQGTGALAILISGLVFAVLLRSPGQRSADWRLFAFWMAFCGLFQSLPQFALVPVEPGTDVAQAFDYFEAGESVRTIAAFIALAAIVIAGLSLIRPLLSLAASEADTASARARTRFVFLAATLPALAAIPIIIAYRIPRELIEVVAPPIAVTIVGISWLQAGAWRVAATPSGSGAPSGAIRAPLLIALALLAAFQLILRPGIPFH